MRLQSLIKTPAETLVHTVKLGGQGGGPVTLTVTARGLVTGGAPLEAAELLVDGDLEINIAGGADGESYAIDVLATMLDGSARTIPLEIDVIAGDWLMPDGGAPMLGVDRFVARFGRDQILRLTDMGDGRIDRGLVVSALTDAQAQAEAHLAGRFTLPFARVPAIVEAIVGDLARAALYEDELPKNVEERRRIALRNLEGFRDGKLTLGTEALPQTAAPADPVRVIQGERAYPDGLKDYSWR